MLNREQLGFWGRLAKRIPAVTVVIIPHGPQKVFKRSLAPGTVRRILASILLSSAVSITFAVNYLKMGRNMAELRELRQINAEQQAQIAQLASEAQDARTKLQRVIQLESQIRELLQKEGINVGGEIHSSVSSNKSSKATPSSSAGLVRAGLILGFVGQPQKARESLTKLDELREEFRALSEAASSTEQRMLALRGYAEALVAYLHAKPNIWPTRGTLTSRFGYRRPPSRYASSYHEGVDIGAAYGAPVYAAGDGVVRFAGWKGGLGRLIIIDHGYGIQTYYGHASKIYVRVGQAVKKGQVIAAVGTSGIATGPHLHYQVVVNGVDVDPLKYLPYGR
ncbi:MAG TPA: peptidoglycan DD-metalloendopeptidase family protein [Firmicutes bacterium]|nr:peptidoglycan DD-metalloendopeptidase family protein [Bacillota bacterium]